MPSRRRSVSPSRTPARAGALLVDPALDRLAYRCHPDGCPRDRTCCVGLVVEASRREVRVIDGLMDELAAMKPSLRDADGYASVFVPDPPGWVIESDDRGACPFLVRTRRHALCAIHTLALRTGRAVPAVKPAACRHWPLMLDVVDGRVRVTVQPHARTIGCVAPRAAMPGQPSVREAFAAEIAELDRLVAQPAGGRSGMPKARRTAR